MDVRLPGPLQKIMASEAEASRLAQAEAAEPLGTVGTWDMSQLFYEILVLLISRNGKTSNFFFNFEKKVLISGKKVSTPIQKLDLSFCSGILLVPDTKTC